MTYNLISKNDGERFVHPAALFCRNKYQKFKGLSRWYTETVPEPTSRGEDTPDKGGSALRGGIVRISQLDDDPHTCFLFLNKTQHFSLSTIFHLFFILHEFPRFYIPYFPIFLRAGLYLLAVLLSKISFFSILRKLGTPQHSIT